MAKKTVKKKETVVVAKSISADVKKLLNVNESDIRTEIAKLSKRIDSIVEAISKAKSIKNL